MLLFFVKSVNFDQFWKNHKFQKFANFRIEIEPMVDSFSLILKKTFPSMFFREKRIRFTLFTLFLLINGHICSKIWNFPEIADDYNFGTEYARDMKFCVKMWSFLVSLIASYWYMNHLSNKFIAFLNSLSVRYLSMPAEIIVLRVVSTYTKSKLILSKCGTTEEFLRSWIQL